MKQGGALFSPRNNHNHKKMHLCTLMKTFLVSKYVLLRYRYEREREGFIKNSDTINNNSLLTEFEICWYKLFLIIFFTIITSFTIQQSCHIRNARIFKPIRFCFLNIVFFMVSGFYKAWVHWEHVRGFLIFGAV